MSRQPVRKSTPTRRTRARGVVRALPFEGDDRALLTALQRRHPAAVAALCERHGEHVKRVLGRILGADPELLDLHHDVFLRAIERAHTLDHADNLRGWLTVVAVNAARDTLRKRKRWRWLAWESAPSAAEATVEVDDTAAEALSRLYELLDKLATDDRIVFSLRIVDGMPLSEVAHACRISLATVKRRLARAELRFEALARRDEVLCTWLEEGDRWG